jgi:hypothetical protein
MRGPGFDGGFKLVQTDFRIFFSSFDFVYFDYCVHFDYGV